MVVFRGQCGYVVTGTVFKGLNCVVHESCMRQKGRWFELYIEKIGKWFC